MDSDLREMSMLDHLGDLRTAILRALIGFGVVFLGCLLFANQLWDIVQAPATDALRQLNADPPNLIALDPMEQFSILWVWNPLIAALFLASPWVVYQAWWFVSPGLHPRERRWARILGLASAALFIAGGAFAYFIAFRRGLVFLLGIGLPAGVRPLISVDRYFSVFVNVMLGVSLIFELPVVIFLLTLIGVASPAFLLSHARYAIMAILIGVALITPSQDFLSMSMLAIPMVVLYYGGVFAGYLLVRKREQLPFPWREFAIWVSVLLGIGAAGWAVIRAVTHKRARQFRDYTKDVAEAEIQIVLNEAGEPTGVLVPIQLWREIASERETAHLLNSETMKNRLLAARQRTDGISMEAVVEKLGI